MSPNKHLNLIGEGDRGGASACATTDEALRNIVFTERLVSDLRAAKRACLPLRGQRRILTCFPGAFSSGALYGAALLLSTDS